ncbi:MAG: hypothetical protein A2X94_17090 [Bdellovibrionales bacterium GWB1_55_8]|nr:MAG: hypothetical protein A2X94_17090 [Bdellovibrionales bacterium GWB1_55_8]
MKSNQSKPAVKVSRTPRVAVAKGRRSTSKQVENHERILESFRNCLQLARIRFEKCELAESEVAYGMALQEARKLRSHRAEMEALSGLLRLASEAINMPAIERWGQELDSLMSAHPGEIPPLAWYCKGTVAWYRRDVRFAQRCWHRCLRAVRQHSLEVSEFDETPPEELTAKAWVALALAWKSEKAGRALSVAQALLQRFEKQDFRTVNGTVYLLLGSIASDHRQLEQAMNWYQKAHAKFLAEHNWYYHLYVLIGYARIGRLQRNYAQAYWHLDLLDKAAWGAHFGQLRREVAFERTRLEKDAVDLLIDSRRGVVKTRDSGQISLRKQYILLHILKALSDAHGRSGADMDRGLSKAEIIERVWKENYRPEAHDNKLYYNINRLRKLIEPDLKKPQYLLNWKEGYRLAPGLRVQFLGDQNGDAFQIENARGGVQ